MTDEQIVEELKKAKLNISGKKTGVGIDFSGSGAALLTFVAAAVEVLSMECGMSGTEYAALIGGKLADDKHKSRHTARIFATYHENGDYVIEPEGDEADVLALATEIICSIGAKKGVDSADMLEAVAAGLRAAKKEGKI